MIKNIEGKTVKVLLKDGKVQLPEEIKQKINEHWEKVVTQNPNLWNGEITCVIDYIENDKELTIVCKKTDYAHYLYDEQIGLPDQYKCYNVFADSLLETQDGYYVIGELDEKMSYPFCMQLPGGNVDDNDMVENEFNILHAIQREVLEELNIDIQDINQVTQNKLKYVMHVLGKGNGYGIVAKTKLKMSAQQMKEYYDKYLLYLKENNLEVEFGKIYCIKKEKFLTELEKLPNPKRAYLKPLIQEDIKNAF